MDRVGRAPGDQLGDRPHGAGGELSAPVVVLVGVLSPPISVRTLLTGWQWGTGTVVALAGEVAVAGWYLVAVRRLAARGRSWSGWRTASFLAGDVLVVVAVQSGLAAYDDQVFAAHVVQHLLLMNLAAICYVLGAPVTLALQSSSRRTQTGLLKVLHHPVVGAVTNPVAVATLTYATMVGYFLTPLYRLSLQHPWFHELTHLHFLVSGTLFWWLVVGLDPSRWRLSHPAKLGVLAVGIPVTAVLGIVLTGAHASIAAQFHTVADTHRGGAILWVAGELTTVAAMGITVFQWMRFEEREAVRADRRLDAGDDAVPSPGDEAVVTDPAGDPAGHGQVVPG
jgi:putative copper resistance protein D